LDNDREIRELYDARPVVPLARIKAAANFFHLTMKYIVDQYLLNKENVELLEKQKEKNAVKKLNRELEDKLHGFQVTPNFYFNALNAASTQAYMESAEKTQEIICAIADISRFSMKYSGRAVPIRLELQNLKNHLLIQKIRFGEKVSFDIEMQDDILDFLIPAMILPTFIENSMTHGIEKGNDRCNIRIFGYMTQMRLYFEIHDDGAGMTEETMDILNDLALEGYPEWTGVQNARRRLRFFFGDDFELVFSRDQVQAGKVRISLSFPAKL
jgi:sensor histidine kinase YesM